MTSHTRKTKDINELAANIVAKATVVPARKKRKPSKARQQPLPRKRS